MEAAAIFVSKRLQRISMALVCLMVIQALSVLPSCSPEVAMGAAARVPITR